MILGVSPFAFGVVVVFALTCKVQRGKNLDAPPARSRSTIGQSEQSNTGTRPSKVKIFIRGRANQTKKNVKKRSNTTIMNIKKRSKRAVPKSFPRAREPMRLLQGALRIKERQVRHTCKSCANFHTRSLSAFQLNACKRQIVDVKTNPSTYRRRDTQGKELPKQLKQTALAERPTMESC